MNDDRLPWSQAYYQGVTAKILRGYLRESLPEEEICRHRRIGADPGEVASPTFALVHEYGPEGGPPRLLHADLYRLPEESRAAAAGGDLGLVEARERGSVVVVEWPEGLDVEDGAWLVSVAPEGEEARRIVVRRAP